MTPHHTHPPRRPLNLGHRNSAKRQPAGEAQDQYAQEYVSDLMHNQVQIWSRNGASMVGAIATPAPPYGVAVDPLLNRVYVALTP